MSPRLGLTPRLTDWLNGCQSQCDFDFDFLAEIELRESLETAVEDDWEEIAKKELGSVKKSSYVRQLQWDWYNFYVEIRCQDTASQDRTLAYV
jgi:hypothetical protein